MLSWVMQVRGALEPSGVLVWFHKVGRFFLSALSSRW